MAGQSSNISYCKAGILQQQFELEIYNSDDIDGPIPATLRNVLQLKSMFYQLQSC